MVIDKKICFLLSGNETLAVLEQVLILSSRLATKNTIHMILPPHLKNSGIGYYEKIKSYLVNVHVLHSLIIDSFKGKREIKKIIVSEQVEVVHTFDLLAAKVMTWFQPEKNHMAHVHTLVDHTELYKGTKKNKKYLKKTIKTNSQTIFTSHYAQEQLVAILKAKKTAVVYPAAIQRVCMSDLKEKKDPYVLFDGEMTRESGCADIVKAFSLVCVGRTNLKLVMMGKGTYKEQIEEAGKHQSLTNRLVFIEEPEDVNELFEKASLFVVPRYDENTSPFVAMALSYGIPIVASDNQIHREYLTHGQTALLVKAGDIFNLAVAMKRVLDEKELTNQMSQLAKDVYKERFNDHHMIDKHVNIYRMI